MSNLLTIAIKFTEAGGDFCITLGFRPSACISKACKRHFGCSASQYPENA